MFNGGYSFEYNALPDTIFAVAFALQAVDTFFTVTTDFNFLYFELPRVLTTL